MTEFQKREFHEQAAEDFRAATPARQDCPDSDLLARLADGWLWPWQRRQLTEHVGHCNACASDLQTVLQVRDELATVLGKSREPTAPAFLRPALAGLAVAVALGLAVSLVSIPEHGPITKDNGPMASSIPASGNSPDDVIFGSDFDGRASEPATLFRDNFDG